MRVPETIDTPDGPSVAGASAGLLGDLLVELEHELATMGAPVRLFRPGLPESTVRERFAQVGRTPPDEVVTWFTWHDGSRADTDGRWVDVFPREHWTLDSVIRRILEPDLPYGTELWEWHPSWVHLTGDNHGLAVDFSRTTTPRVRALSEGSVSTHDPGLAHQVVSLCTPVTWWIEAIRSGAIQWEPDLRGLRKDFSILPIERWRIGVL